MLDSRRPEGYEKVLGSVCWLVGSILDSVGWSLKVELVRIESCKALRYRSAFNGFRHRFALLSPQVCFEYPINLLR
jgi:hypothetical protein